MAKVSLTKLGLKVNQNVKNIEFNEQIIEVKQYLPIDDKLNLIARVIENSYDIKNNFSNPVKINVFGELEIIMAYTNLSFTDKQYLLYSYLIIIDFNFLLYEFIVFSTSAANIGLFASSVTSNASDKLSLIKYKKIFGVLKCL